MDKETVAALRAGSKAVAEKMATRTSQGRLGVDRHIARAAQLNNNSSVWDQNRIGGDPIAMTVQELVAAHCKSEADVLVARCALQEASHANCAILHGHHVEMVVVGVCPFHRLEKSDDGVISHRGGSHLSHMIVALAGAFGEIAGGFSIGGRMTNLASDFAQAEQAALQIVGHHTSFDMLLSQVLDDILNKTNRGMWFLFRVAYTLLQQRCIDNYQIASIINAKSHPADDIIRPVLDKSHRDHLESMFRLYLKDKCSALVS